MPFTRKLPFVSFTRMYIDYVAWVHTCGGTTDQFAEPLQWAESEHPIYAPDHWGVFNFMQRHTDLQARVAACIRGRDWKRRREVWLFLLQVVMLSRGLDTRTTDKMNNCNICQMHRCFRNVFKSKKHFLYTA